MQLNLLLLACTRIHLGGTGPIPYPYLPVAKMRCDRQVSLYCLLYMQLRVEKQSYCYLALPTYVTV